MLTALLKRFARLLALLLGTWQAPPWLRALVRWLAGAWGAVREIVRRRPRLVGVAVLGLALALGAGDLGFRAWRRRPRPELILAQPGALVAMGLFEGAKPSPLEVVFLHGDERAAAAKLSLVGKIVPAGIEMSPKLEGTWTWLSDSELSFQPVMDWPVGTTLRLTFSKEIFGPQVNLESRSVTVDTPRFVAGIDSAEFYQDPRDPKTKRVVAELHFSHPVDTANLSGRLHLHDLGGGGLFKGPSEVPISVRYDKFKGRAYVQSEVLPIPDEDRVLLLEITAGVRAQRGGPGTPALLSTRVVVPGRANFFRITETTLGVADDEAGELQQVATFSTNTEVQESVMNGAVSAILLPKDRPADADHEKEENARWDDSDDSKDISEAVVRSGRAIALTPIPADHEIAKVFHYRYRAPPGRWLLLKVKAGILSFGDYPLVKPFSETKEVPAFTPMLHVQGSGAVLSLAGEKKVSLVARQLDAIHVDLMRVLPAEVRHLVTQNNGSFETPSFNYGFAPEDIAERFSEVLPLVQPQPGKNQYASFDFSRYLDEGRGENSREGNKSAPRGLFFLTATGWDPVKETDLEPKDSRFILVTDLGLLAKKSADGSRDLYVQRLSQGAPAAGARVEVLGRNGLTVAEASSDAEGHVHFPDLSSLTREKQAVVFLVTLGSDLSFLPVDRDDRSLNYSRFDIGGVQEDARAGALHAFVFSDRGLYRPGDTVHVAGIVKQSDWDKRLTGVPLRWVVTDPRSAVLQEKRFKLTPAAFEELSFRTRDTSATGTYTASLYTVRDEKAGGAELLGEVAVRVEEFLPDRLRISSHFVPDRLEGWVKPEQLSAEVDLQNLFGTPAENRRVVARLTLSPQPPAFGRYPDFAFFNPAEAKEKERESQELTEGRTDAAGHAVFALDLSKYEKATYRLKFTADGFEAEGGRAVSTESSVLVSPFDFLVGVKTDGDLSFVGRGATRAVELLAVDSTLQPRAVSALHAVLLEERYVSVLTEQQGSGLYRYVSTLKEITVSDQPLSLGAKPTPWKLDTKNPGNFVVSVREGNTEMARVHYSVAGRANLTRTLDRNAELEVKLDHKDYAEGDTIQVSITAPYEGAGLLTIERDHVYAARWFKTTSTSSVQTITVPGNLEGNGYVNVSFVRALDSPEVFMSPLSSGVVPFSVSRASRTDVITLNAPALVKPGEVLEVRYQVSHPSRLIVFGVDEGILQVAHYRTPDPLAFFFRKRSLQVTTSQILDLLLPEFSQLSRASAAGGDEGVGASGKNLNPFKRKRDLPVAFWSGLIDADGAGSFRATIPDSFSGQLRVMAVAVASAGGGAVGAQTAQVTVRGPFVLSPNVPSFVAPGDEFVVSVGVANNVEGSRSKAKVAVRLELGAGLLALDGLDRQIEIDEGHESSTAFRLRATQQLGSADLLFRAQTGAARSQLRTALSVRPAVPYMVTTQVGQLQSGRGELPHGRKLFAQERTLQASASHLPLGLAGGLAAYLQAYPYGCTEQIVSEAFPALVMQDRPDFGYSAPVVEASLERAYQVLAERQNGEGAFGMWAANSTVSNFQNAYAAHFLTEAKQREQGAPREVLERSLQYLGGLAAEPVESLADGREHAYALYVLARNGKPVGAAAAALQKRLEVLSKQDWRTDLAAAYLAATYKILHQEELASTLVGHLALGQRVTPDYGRYYDGLTRDGQLLFLLASHFPERLKRLSPAELGALATSLAHGYNSLSAASAMLGFDALARALAGDVGANVAPPSAFELLTGGPRPLALSAGLFPKAAFSDQATAVRFVDSSGLPLFYGITEAGYDLNPPDKIISAGLELEREYQKGGKSVSSAKVGDLVEVHLKVRASSDPVPNVAIVDLLPAGFEVVVDHAAPPPGGSADGDDQAAPDDAPSAGEDSNGPPSASQGDAPDGQGIGTRSAGGMASFIYKSGDLQVESADVREDRVLVFAGVDEHAREFVYQIRATNQGSFAVPPVFGESMYDRAVQARSLGARFEITAP